MASADLIRLKAGDLRLAIDRGLDDFVTLRALAIHHLWSTYETCPAELYLLLGKDPQGYDDVCEAICEAILHSLGYMCVVTECPPLLGDEPLVEWSRSSDWRYSGRPPLPAH